MINPNVQAIVDKVAEKFSKYTTPESITPMVVTQAIAEAVQSLYAVPDVFMANNNIEEMDFSNYINVERIFTLGNNFKEADLSLVTNLKHLEIDIPQNGVLDLSNQTQLKNLIIGSYLNASNNIDLSNNTNLEELVIKDYYSDTLNDNIDLSNLLNLKKLHINYDSASNDKVTALPFISPVIEDLSLKSFLNLNNVGINLSVYPTLKKIQLYYLQNVSSLNLSTLTNLDTLKISKYPNTTLPVFADNPNLKEIEIFHDTLTELDYQDILGALVDNNLEKGSVALKSDSGTIVLTPTGEAYKTTLESRGWGVVCY